MAIYKSYFIGAITTTVVMMGIGLTVPAYASGDDNAPAGNAARDARAGGGPKKPTKEQMAEIKQRDAERERMYKERREAERAQRQTGGNLSGTSTSPQLPSSSSSSAPA
ncbi:MAG: hypothetical protein ACRC2U_17775, partial [Aeromonas sp.]